MGSAVNRDGAHQNVKLIYTLHSHFFKIKINENA